MNTKQYRYLLTVAQYGNLSHAAQALGVSQPALSKALKEWEKTIGCTLFFRHHHQLVPTHLGRCVLEYGEKILEEQSRMLVAIRQTTGAERKEIRLCTAPNRAAMIYSQVVHEFSRRFPDTALQLVEHYASEQPGAVRRGTVDLALGAGPVSREVEDIPFAREELLVALPASHPLAEQKNVHLAELRDMPFVLQGRKHSIRGIADRLFEEAGFLPLIAFESNDVFLIDAMLHQAAGAGLVSKIHVKPCEDLRYLSLDPPVYQLMHIRYPRGHILTEAERYLAGLLISRRLSDSRYEAVASEEVERLLEAVRAEESEPPGVVCNAGEQDAREISLSPQVLRYLIAIEEEKSLTAAAERCYLAQSALSRYLRDVEGMIGVTLFSRAHNRLVPTNAGKIFINDARNMLRFEAEMEKMVETYREGHGGRLVIACDSLLRDRLEAQCVPVMQIRHPEVRVHVLEGTEQQIQEMLCTARADVGITLSGSPQQPMLDQAVLGTSELVFLPAELHREVTAGFPIEGGGCRMMLALQNTPLRKVQEELLNRYFLPAPRVVGEAELSILLQLAEAGMTDMILPLELLTSVQRQRAVKYSGKEQISVVLARNPERECTQAMEELIGILREAFDAFFSAGKENESSKGHE